MVCLCSLVMTRESSQILRRIILHPFSRASSTMSEVSNLSEDLGKKLAISSEQPIRNGLPHLSFVINILETKFHVSRTTKKFTVNGELTNELDFFFVKPKIDKLREHIQQGDYVLLQGNRGVGKTTSIRYLENQLTDKKFFYLSMQSLEFQKNEEAFWISFGNRLKYYMKKYNITTGRKNL